MRNFQLLTLFKFGFANHTSLRTPLPTANSRVLVTAPLLIWGGATSGTTESPTTSRPGRRVCQFSSFFLRACNSGKEFSYIMPYSRTAHEIDFAILEAPCADFVSAAQKLATHNRFERPVDVSPNISACHRAAHRMAGRTELFIHGKNPSAHQVLALCR